MYKASILHIMFASAITMCLSPVASYNHLYCLKHIVKLLIEFDPFFL